MADSTTSGFSVGDTLYIDTTAGAVTKTKPTGESSQLQNIGRVIRSDNGDGVIMVGGAGRSAATPNLDQDKIFLGNASNQSVSTALSAIGLSKFNNDSGFLTDITGESLNDLSDVSYTAGAGIDNYVLTLTTEHNWGAEAIQVRQWPEFLRLQQRGSDSRHNNKALVPSNLSSVDLSVLDNTTSAITSVTFHSKRDSGRSSLRLQRTRKRQQAQRPTKR